MNQTLTMDVRRNRDRRSNLDLEAVHAILDTRDPIDDRTLTRLAWWAKRRHHRAIYRAAQAQGDSHQRATHLAKRMVTEFGMSEKLGSVRYAGQRLQYMGTPIAESSDASAATHETIDAEVRRIVGAQFERAATLVAAHRDALRQLSAELLKAESLDGSAVRAALSSAGHAVAS